MTKHKTSIITCIFEGKSNLKEFYRFINFFILYVHTALVKLTGNVYIFLTLQTNNFFIFFSVEINIYNTVKLLMCIYIL